MGRGTRLRQASAWIIPLAYAAIGLIGGIWTERLAQRVAPDVVSEISASTAVAFYSAVATGMLALTAIVFSLSLVAMQLTGSTFSPRLVSLMTHDRIVSHALGVFIATFLYALAALVWVDRGGSGRVSVVGALGVTTLLIVSVCMFIALTQHVGILQVNRILTFVAAEARGVVDSLYAPLDSHPATDWVPPAGGRSPVVLRHHGAPRTFQAIDSDALIRLAERHDAQIELTAAVGETVLDGTPMVRVYAGGEPPPQPALRRAIQLGSERIFDQDPSYAIRLLVDIAIRALSPAVNDPTTAVQALDYIGDLLVRLGRRRIGTCVHRDAAGHPRVVVHAPGWEELVRLGLDEIRFYGATSVQVLRRMNALVTELLAALPAERHPVLLEWQQRIRATALHAFSDDADRVEALAEDRQGLGGARVVPAATVRSDR